LQKIVLKSKKAGVAAEKMAIEAIEIPIIKAIITHKITIEVHIIDEIIINLRQESNLSFISFHLRYNDKSHYNNNY